jgi:hypothetical protein
LHQTFRSRKSIYELRSETRNTSLSKIEGTRRIVTDLSGSSIVRIYTGRDEREENRPDPFAPTRRQREARETQRLKSVKRAVAGRRKRNSDPKPRSQSISIPPLPFPFLPPSGRYCSLFLSLATKPKHLSRAKWKWWWWENWMLIVHANLSMRARNS